MEKRQLNTYGKMMILVGFINLSALLALPFSKGDIQYAWCFILPASISIIAGWLIGRIPSTKEYLTARKLDRYSIILTLFSWFYCFFVASIPYMLGKQLSVVQSLFEAISGYTTTGLTVVDVEVMPRIFMLHRSMTNYFGGLGIVLMFISILKEQVAMNMFNAEGHTDRFMPNIQKTARAIFIIYNILMVFGILGFMSLGMNFYDAFTHSVGSLFTGGFSSRSNSLAYYNSPSINLFSVIMMILGAVNPIVFVMITNGKANNVFKVSEIRLFFYIIIGFSLTSAIVLTTVQHLALSDSLVTSVSWIVSGLTTCGNGYGDLNTLHPLLLGLIFACMVLGGCAGSTSGGIKSLRIVILVKTIFSYITKKTSSSQRMVSTQQTVYAGETEITDDAAIEVFAFVGMYLFVLLVGAFTLTLTCGCTMWEGLFEFASSLGLVGLSLGYTSPLTNVPTLLVEMTGMILGRLEIFLFIIGIYYIVNGAKKALKRKA